MEAVVNEEFQKLIDKLDMVVTASEDTNFREAGLDIIKDVQYGIKMLGTRPVVAANVQKFVDITDGMVKTYIAKNHDYGNSFVQSLDKFGLIASIVRMGDKMNRIETLASKKAEVKDESVEDTLLDLANYAIMTVMWLRNSRCIDGKPQNL